MRPIGRQVLGFRLGRFENKTWQLLSPCGHGYVGLKSNFVALRFLALT
jgi:hypothetical protein